MSWNPAVDNTGISVYEIYRNNEKIYTTSKTSYTDRELIPETTYTYTVYAKDDYGNYSEAADGISATTLADSEAPSIPQNLKIKRKTGSSISISWNSSIDNFDVAGYEIYKNDKKIDSVTDTFYKDSDVELGKTYIYKVLAYDYAGNKSELSNHAVGSASTPNIISISPSDLSIIGGESIKLSVVFADSGNSIGNKVKFEYSTDRENWNDISPSLIGQQAYSSKELSASYIWYLDNLNSGDYYVRATLYDEDGNTDIEEAIYTFKTDAPPAPRSVIADGTNGTVWLNWERSISTDCAYYNIYKSFDGINYEKISATENSGVVAYFDKNVQSGSTYYYKLTSVSKYNKRESAYSNISSVTVSPDEKIPEIKAILPTNNKINKQTNCTVEAFDNIEVAKVKLEYTSVNEENWIIIGEENAANGKASFIWDTSILTDGEYYLRASAYDTSGNISEEFKKLYEIDNTGISKIEISDVKSGSSFVSIKWNDISEKDFGYFSIEQLKNGSFVEISKEKSTLGVHITDLQSDTYYTFRVVGYDNIGNRGIESDEITVITESDNTPPSITSLYPASSDFKSNIPLKVTVSDNISAKSVSLYYSLDKINWNSIKTLSSDNSNKINTFEYNFDISEISEGLVYIKAVAYDAAGNSSSEAISEFKIDKTAPESINDLKAEGASGYISLSWTTTSDDTEYFIISRANEADGVYSVINSKCTTKNYYDTTAQLNTIYSYKISAVDTAGNISNESNTAVGQALKDTDIPIVGGLSPVSNSVVPNNPTLKAVATDNNKVRNITFEYKPEDTEESLWTEIATIDVNQSYKVVSTKWNTDVLDEGKYNIRIFASDVSGNISKSYEVTYILDKTAPTVPVIEVLQQNWQMTIKWNDVSCDDFSNYRLYRKSESESDFNMITELGDSSYIDNDIIPNVLYSYKVEAYDKAGNYSSSEIVSGVAYKVDTVSPMALTAEKINAISGYEIEFDGTESWDNVRVVKYEWDTGDGTKIYGARPKYIYENSGNYKAKLTVWDEYGNSNSCNIAVEVLDPTLYGNIQIEIVDNNKVPIKYAQVYLKVSDTEEQFLKTDSLGRLNICSTLGEHKMAIYKQGYLPLDETIQITSVGNEKIHTFTLASGELITGDLSYHRMSLEEMVEAGINMYSPDNYHCYKFSVSLTFAQKPIPTKIEIISDYDGDCNITYVDYDGEVTGKGKGKFLEFNGSKYQFTIVKSSDENGEEDNEIPILAYIRTGDNEVKWLKDMYTVDLGVLNNANSYFTIENSYTILSLPRGLSFASTTKSNTAAQSMGTIRGQENKYVSWYIKGDLPGTYNLSALFSGKLMPFNTDVGANFVCESPITVSVGNGLVIYVQPEASAYINEPYYIQYSVKNESSRTYYNVSTNFGKFKSPQQVQKVKVKNKETGEYEIQETLIGQTYTIAEANKCPILPVTYGGETLEIGVLKPGDAIFGTFETTFSGAGDPEEFYYELIETLIKEIENSSNSAIEVRVDPIPSHMTRYNLERIEIPKLFADPIDMTTGAFTDELTLMSVESDSILQFDMTYNSLNCENAGELGYGWSHEFESYIEDVNGRKQLHFSKTNYITFITEDAVKRNVCGTIVDEKIILESEDDIGAKNYECISVGMSDYKLSRDEEENYTLKMPSGEILKFNSQGKLIKYIEHNGKEILFEHYANQTVIIEPITGKKIKLNYSDIGFLTSVEDENGRRSTFVYENNCLISVTNPLKETTHYTYDDKNRIIAATNDDGIQYVTNTYDSENRVLTQDDADSSTPLTYFEYSKEDGIELVTATDRNGNKVKYYSNSYGNIVKSTNQNGESITYGYDSKGNNIIETDPYGNTMTHSYDDKGNLISTIDYVGNETKITYDERGNVMKICFMFFCQG